MLLQEFFNLRSGYSVRNLHMKLVSYNWSVQYCRHHLAAVLMLNTGSEKVFVQAFMKPDSVNDMAADRVIECLYLD